MIKKANLYYMDTDSLIVYIKTNDIRKNIAEDVERRLIPQIMNQDPIPLKDHCLKEKNKKVVELMKDELGTGK